MPSPLEKCLALADDVEEFPLGRCGPSDDPDKQTAFIFGFRDIAKRFIAAAVRLADQSTVARLRSTNTSPDTIEDAYDLRAELMAVIDGIRDRAQQENAGSTMQHSLAKLKALRKNLAGILADPKGRYIDAEVAIELCERQVSIVESLRQVAPHLFSDLPKREVPASSNTTDFDGRGYVPREKLEKFARDVDYIEEISSHSVSTKSARPDRVFVSHGRAVDWREVQAHIEKDVGLQTLELAQEPNQGRTVLQKLSEEAERCAYAVVVMTGDDVSSDGQLRARENVMHEVGYFQGKYGLDRVCLLHEDGTSIPSNIHGLVYIPFPKGLVRAAFSDLSRELRAAFREGSP